MSREDGSAGVGEHRYEGYSLEIKHGWMQGGPGAEAVTDARDLLDDLAAGFAESERTVRAALAGLGVSWDGGAADSAAAALAAVADQARAAGQGSAEGGARIREYGDSFARTRPRIAEPPSGGATFDAPTSDLAAITGLQSDHRAGLAEYHRLDRQANDALYAHEAAGRAAVVAFPSPTTALAAGGMARAGGAIPDPGPVGVTPAGVDPGGVIAGDLTGAIAPARPAGPAALDRPRWGEPELPRAPAAGRWGGSPSRLGPPGVGPFGSRGSGYPAETPSGRADPGRRDPGRRHEQPCPPTDQPFAVDLDGVPPVLGLESRDRRDDSADGEPW